MQVYVVLYCVSMCILLYYGYGMELYIDCYTLAESGLWLPQMMAIATQVFPSLAILKRTEKALLLSTTPCPTLSAHTESEVT